MIGFDHAYDLNECVCVVMLTSNLMNTAVCVTVYPVDVFSKPCFLHLTVLTECILSFLMKYVNDTWTQNVLVLLKCKFTPAPNYMSKYLKKITGTIK